VLVEHDGQRKVVQVVPDVPAALGRVKEVAGKLAELRHPCLVRVEDVLPVGQGWGLVTAYAPGADVTTQLRSGPLPARVALGLAAEVAGALEAAHRVGLVHRDLRPGNVRVTRHGDVRILHFGICPSDFVVEGVRRHAPDHVAPERWSGDDGPPGDVWALGVTLTELLGAAGDTAADIVGLIERMTGREPASRPTARESARLLRALEAQSMGPTLAEWATAAVPALEMIEETRREGPPRMLGPAAARVEDSTRPWATPVALLAAGLLAGLGATALGAFALLRTPEPSPEPPPAPAPQVRPPGARSGPAPVQSPVESPVPVPAADRPEPSGRLVLEGDASSATIEGGAALDAVPPGTYVVTVAFGGGVAVTIPGVRIREGRATVMDCREKFATCTVR
jgi:serine/threonine-protein kinase